MTTNENPAAVRVCAIADIQCSRGCGTGTCKREQPTPCIHADDPKACYRVRCQLGGKCVDDDMSPRQPAAAPIDRAEMVKSWGEISSQMFAKMTPWQFYEAGWTAARTVKVLGNPPIFVIAPDGMAFPRPDRERAHEGASS